MPVFRGLGTLLDAWAPKVAQAFQRVVADIKGLVQPSHVAARLVAVGPDAAATAVPLQPALFRPLDQAIEQAFEGGGKATIDALPAARGPDGGRIRTIFDIRSPAAEAWLRDHSSTLVREIIDDQRAAIRARLVAGMEAGRNPRDVALDLVGRVDRATGRRVGGIIGLTAYQEAIVRNYAAELARADAAALDRQLRDPRYDGALKRAIAEGKPLAADQITRMVAAYESRMLRHRGETIAKTETTPALYEARIQALEQASASGRIDIGEVRKRWRDSGGPNVRHTHRLLNGQTVPARASFVSSSGAILRYPADPRAPAAERVNCECDIEILFGR
ncbi:hypothetical protein [Methylobacterium aquaticum]|uniref:Phage head morphogenesis domain-containing protein n=1 Tax=Methylobacterium aquaticum TaxID=270351 RepID=A0A0C6FC21_9HYPH|nr:hypothetical protein [Methylobacterium aquaticum]BAQ44397.1 hypothetical protein Maq22A_c05015 [Methylobacterium aquaticum]